MNIDKLYVFTDGSCCKKLLISNNKSINYTNTKQIPIGAIGIYFYTIDSNINTIFENHSKIIDNDGQKITNQTMELLACIQALQIIKEKVDNNSIKVNVVYIYTDSLYVINSVLKWINIWKNNGWKTTKGKDVENKELIEILYTLKNSTILTIFKHVKAHQKEPIDKNAFEYKIWYGNYMADKLAKNASLKYIEHNINIL